MLEGEAKGFILTKWYVNYRTDRAVKPGTWVLY